MTLIHKAYKTELKPNKQQSIVFNKSVGTARWVWNWALGKRKQEYDEIGKSSNWIMQSREFTTFKKQPDYAWLNEVSRCVVTESLKALDLAFASFFRRLKRKEKPGFPKFKSKDNYKQSFCLKGGIQAESKHIKLPRIGKVQLKEVGYIPIDKKIISVTISKCAQRWFVSVLVEEEIDVTENTGGAIIGIDIGINKHAVTSDNRVFLNNKAYVTGMERLGKAQRRLSRKTKGSNNRKKAKARVQKQHYHIANIRKNAIHQMTTAIAKTIPAMVAIEDLAVCNMIQNKHLSKHIADAGFAEIRRQLEYKSKWNGFKITVVDRWFPSSKLCSACGCLHTSLDLSKRTYICKYCGLVLDRDLNAAINLKNYAENPEKWSMSNIKNIAKLEPVSVLPEPVSRVSGKQFNFVV